MLFRVHSLLCEGRGKAIRKHCIDAYFPVLRIKGGFVKARNVSSTPTPRLYHLPKLQWSFPIDSQMFSVVERGLISRQVRLSGQSCKEGKRFSCLSDNFLQRVSLFSWVDDTWWEVTGRGPHSPGKGPAGKHAACSTIQQSHILQRVTVMVAGKKLRWLLHLRSKLLIEYFVTSPPLSATVCIRVC